MSAGAGASEAVSVASPHGMLSTDLLSRVGAFADIWDRMRLAVVCKAYHAELEQSLWAIRSGLRLFRTDSAAAIAALQAAGLLGRTEQHVADFLYTSKGRIPARFVGQYLTKAYADADATREEKARNKRLLILYLRRFDFDSDTPVQALRRLLTRTRMPRESRSSSNLLKRFAERYVECQRHAARRATAEGAADFCFGLPLPTEGPDAAVPAAVALSSSGASGGVVAAPSAPGAGAGAGAESLPATPPSAEGMADLLTAARGVSGRHLEPDTDDGATEPPAGTARRGASATSASAAAAGAVGMGGPLRPPAGAAAEIPPGAPPAAMPSGLPVGVAAATAGSLEAALAQLQRRMLYGFDVASLDVDTAFIITWSAIILNTDMRHVAIKAKMRREEFIHKNTGVAGLGGIPASFFAGLYDELAVQGLPVSDAVPTAPAAHAFARGQPDAATVSALRHLVPPSASAAQLLAVNAQAVRERAESAFQWMRSAVRAVGTAVADGLRALEASPLITGPGSGELHEVGAQVVVEPAADPAAASAVRASGDVPIAAEARPAGEVAAPAAAAMTLSTDAGSAPRVADASRVDDLESQRRGAAAAEALPAADSRGSRSRIHTSLRLMTMEGRAWLKSTSSGATPSASPSPASAPAGSISRAPAPGGVAAHGGLSVSPSVSPSLRAQAAAAAGSIGDERASATDSDRARPLAAAGAGPNDRRPSTASTLVLDGRGRSSSQDTEASADGGRERSRTPASTRASPVSASERSLAAESGSPMQWMRLSGRREASGSERAPEVTPAGSGADGSREGSVSLRRHIQSLRAMLPASLTA